MIISLMFLSFFGMIYHPSIAQQEPHFTHYMFNTLAYNPAYAGSREYMSVVAVYRDQWFNPHAGTQYDGRPISMTFSVHSPLHKRIGVGLNMMGDRIGVRKTNFLNGVYAYRMGFGKGILSAGIQAGIMNWRANWDKLTFKDPRSIDNAFSGENPELWLPDFGAGLFYYTKNFYSGFSIPHLIQYNLRKLKPEEKSVIRKWASIYRHLYFTTGGIISIRGESLILKPSILIQSIGFFNEFFKRGHIVREIGAPTVFHLNVSLFFQKQLCLGISYRSAFSALTEPKGSANLPNPKRSTADSVDALMALYLKNGFRIGFSYDYPLGKLRTSTVGSFEFMLGYDFFYQVEKISSPRYF